MLPSNASDWEVVNPPPKKRGNGVGGLAVMVGLLVVLAGVIYVAVTHLPTGLPSQPTAATSPAAPAASAAPTAQPGTPADAATEQAIEAVIQQVDAAQVQAIATNDPSVMTSTATSDFYQAQVATNDDLANSGVTDIKLVKIEWGPVTVNGNQAIATDYETWSTTFDDGTTDQSRDRNVYTLVQDNGTWKVSADDHPDDQAAGSNGTPGQAPAP